MIAKKIVMQSVIVILVYFIDVKYFHGAYLIIKNVMNVVVLKKSMKLVIIIMLSSQQYLKKIIQKKSRVKKRKMQKNK